LQVLSLFNIRKGTVMIKMEDGITDS